LEWGCNTDPPLFPGETGRAARTPQGFYKTTFPFLFQIMQRFFSGDQLSRAHCSLSDERRGVRVGKGQQHVVARQLANSQKSFSN